MRNIHKHLISTIIPTMLCAIAGPASAIDLDSLESVAAVCEFSEAAENPFRVPEDPMTQGVEQASRRAQGREISDVSNVATVSREQGETTAEPGSVYSLMSMNTRASGEIEIYPRAELLNDDSGPSARHAAPVDSADSQADEPRRIEEMPVGDTGSAGSSILEAEAAMRYAQSRRRQLAQTYETVVDASQFRVVSYDAASETLTVSLNEPMEISGAVATISLADDNSLMFAVNAEAADYIETQWMAGGVELRLRYELISRQETSRSYCSRNEMGGPELSGALLEATMVESMHRRELTSMQTDRAVREHCSRRAASQRDRDSHSDSPSLVGVHTLESFGSEMMSEAEAVMLTVFAELVLGDCFFDARISNAALEGAVVVSFELTPSGDMEAAQLTIDALRSEQFRSCAVDAFSRSQIPREAEAGALDTRMTLIFSSGSR